MSLESILIPLQLIVRYFRTANIFSGWASDFIPYQNFTDDTHHLPVPQVVEQALHAVHEETTQSLGQQLCVHERVCRVVGHAALQ